MYYKRTKRATKQNRLLCIKADSGLWCAVKLLLLVNSKLALDTRKNH